MAALPASSGRGVLFSSVVVEEHAVVCKLTSYVKYNPFSGISKRSK